MNSLPILVPPTSEPRKEGEEQAPSNGSPDLGSSLPISAQSEAMSPTLESILLLAPPKPQSQRDQLTEPSATSFGKDASDPAGVIDVDETLRAAVRIAQDVLPKLGRFSADAENASHEAVFCAYQFLKAREHNPTLHEKRLVDAHIMPRKNRSEAVRSLQLILKTAGYATAKSTLHDWANWLTVMDADGVTVSRDAVFRYRTEKAFIGGREVKGTERLKARLNSMKSAKAAESRERREHDAAERGSRAMEQFAAGERDPVGRIEIETDLEDDGDGLNLWIGRDRSIAGRLKVTEDIIYELLGKYGMER
jgi:hypothetical protein